MLDQNTDRMWYVIGAVIIGAALIFILNGTAPELFASIGGTFESKTEDVTKVVDDLTMTDGVGPVGKKTILTNGSFDDGLTGWLMNGVATSETIDGRTVAKIAEGNYTWESSSNSGGLYQTGLLKEAGSVKITFDARAVSGSAKANVGFLNTRSSKVVDLTESWGTYTFTTSTIDISNAARNAFHIYFKDHAFYIDRVSLELVE